MPISDIVAVVCQVQCFNTRQPIGSGSGFFYTLEDQLYLITNRHVVIDEKEDFYPDEIRVRLHTNPNDVYQNEQLAMPIYESDEPAWREHPSQGANVDVVALPLDTEAVKKKFFIRSLAPSNHIPTDVDIPIGEDIQVIGYPLGFHDALHNLPIVRNATLASVYPVPFQGNPYILIDSRLHSGTSGSPVMTKPTNMIRKADGSTTFISRSVGYLVGVHSATVEIPTRDPSQDEPLGLNVVWFASLIPDIIRGGVV